VTGGRRGCLLLSIRLNRCPPFPREIRMAEPAFELRPALTYATHGGGALQGDLYLPKAAGPAPALIAVHGGGWQQGARSAFQHWGPYLAARGYALFAIS
jgi:acetyl esterase/lipase